jgi:dihydrofolate reductase/thymidylate synthase
MKKDKCRFYVVLTRNIDLVKSNDYSLNWIYINDFRQALQFCNMLLNFSESSQTNSRIGVDEFNKFFNVMSENKYPFMNVQYYKVFVIGGADIYNLAMSTGLVTEIYETIYNAELEIEHGIYFKLSTELESQYKVERNQYVTKFILTSNTSNQLNCAWDDNVYFNYYEKKCEPYETQYIRLVKNIIKSGSEKVTRGISTKSIIGNMIKVDLNDGFPITTMKPGFMRGIIEELLWMLRGDTNANNLKNKNVHIWDEHSSRQWLDKSGLNDYIEGDIGAGYGFQMRHFGTEYEGCVKKYENAGVDQLKESIDMIKNDPNNRRIIISLWNPVDTKKMSLPPCHVLYKFSVMNNKLSCSMYQRSWDVLLGWNTSTAALLTHILAHFTGLDVGHLTHFIDDAHIYMDHIEVAKNEVINQLPYKLPKLKIIGNVPDKIEKYVTEKFVLENYIYHEKKNIKIIAGDPV